MTSVNVGGHKETNIDGNIDVVVNVDIMIGSCFGGPSIKWDVYITFFTSDKYFSCDWSWLYFLLQ